MHKVISLPKTSHESLRSKVDIHVGILIVSVGSEENVVPDIVLSPRVTRAT